MCKQIIGDTINAGKSLVILVAMRIRWYKAGEHCRIEHILGFTRSYWMPPWGKYLRHIVPAAVMVDKFIVKHNTLTKNYF
jgi:hypothetical protein